VAREPRLNVLDINYTPEGNICPGCGSKTRQRALRAFLSGFGDQRGCAFQQTMRQTQDGFEGRFRPKPWIGFSKLTDGPVFPHEPLDAVRRLGCLPT